MPAIETGASSFWVQKVSPAGARNSTGIDCPDEAVRAMALSQSCPTAQTNEPGALVVSDALGAPLIALRTVDAPGSTEAVLKATTCIMTWYGCASVAMIVS